MVTVIHENIHDMRKSLFVTIVAVGARSLLVCLLTSGSLREYATNPATRSENPAALSPEHDMANGKPRAQKQVCAPYYGRVLWFLKALRLLLGKTKL